MALIKRFTPGGNIYPDGSSTFAMLREFFQAWAENRDAMDQTIAQNASVQAAEEIKPLALQPTQDSTAVFAVTDEDGLRTWLEVAPDGGPTGHAAEKIAPSVAPAAAAAVGVGDQDSSITGLSFAVVDEDGLRTWIEADQDGAPTPRATQMIGAGLGLDGTQFTSGPAISCIGDSLTAGSGGTPYPTTLATLTGHTVHNLGVGGETSWTIAGRAGGRPWLASPAGGSIPASGGVTLTLTTDDGKSPTPLQQHEAGGAYRGTNPVVIAGVTGTLTRDGAGTYTFTRATAGTAVPVPRPAAVITQAMRTRRGDITVMWWGQNDGTNDATDIIGRQRATIEALTALQARWLVLGLSTSTAVTRAPMEAQFIREFGRRFINLRAWLATETALTAEGITPTTTDLEQIANDSVPESLRIDSTHLNTAGYTQVAKAVHARLIELEWI